MKSYPTYTCHSILYSNNMYYNSQMWYHIENLEFLTRLFAANSNQCNRVQAFIYYKISKKAAMRIMFLFLAF